MLGIPLISVPSQTFNVVLAGQPCRIAIYQKSTGLFMDLSMAGSPIFTGVLCRDRVRLVRMKYLGFVGDLAFVDTQGKDDPNYAGLGSRWDLVYLDPAEAI